MHTLSKTILEGCCEKAPSDAVHARLAAHLEKVLAGMVHMSMAFVTVEGRKTVREMHVDLVKNFMDVSCKKTSSKSQSGGGATVLPAAYFEPENSETHSAAHVGTPRNVINWDSGMQFDGLAMSMSMNGGGMMGLGHAKDMAKKMFHESGLRIQKSAVEKLMGVFHAYTTCLAKDLTCKKLTVERLEKILKKKVHKLFC